MSQHRRKAPPRADTRQSGRGGSGTGGSAGRDSGERDYRGRPPDGRGQPSRENTGREPSGRGYGGEYNRSVGGRSGGLYRDDGYGPGTGRPPGRVGGTGQGRGAPGGRAGATTAARPMTRAEARRAAAGRASRGGGRGGGSGGGGGKRLIDYPRSGRTGLRRWIPSPWQLAGVAIGGFAAALGLVGIAYAMIPIPDANADIDNQTTVIYDTHNKIIAKLNPSQQRTKVDLSQVPVYVQDAVLAAENRTFYSDSGISPRGMARAMWTDLHGGATQGGSTITQQLAKNAYLTQERTFSRKFKEFFIAIKLDRERDKKEILQEYLNTIYFGRHSWGIEAASEAYFHVSVAKLTPAQGAVLASVIRAPGLYDPAKPANQTRLTARFRYVVDGMAKMGAITPQQAATMAPPRVYPPRSENQYQGQRGYLVAAVKRELQAIDGERYSDDALDTGGFRIKATFDLKLVAEAEKAVQTVTKEQKLNSKMRIGLAAVQPGTGRVLASYGGPDYLKAPRDNALQDRTQAGSTFKAFTLAAAFSKDPPILLESRFAGNSPYHIPDSPDDKPVNNEDDQDYGRFVSLRTAIEKSINSAFVDATVTKIGPKNVKEAALAAGIPDSAGLQANARITLGTDDVRVVDVADGYATFASNGMAAKPYVVTEVRAADGRVTYKAHPEPKRAFSEEVTSNVNYALQKVVQNGTGERAQALNRPVAGKTGTTDENNSAWFAGYTPQVSAAVALFRDDGDGKVRSLKPLNHGVRVDGKSYPAMVWTEFMKLALADQEAEAFPDRISLADGKVVNPPAVERPKPTPTFEETLPPVTLPPTSSADPTFTPPSDGNQTSTSEPSCIPGFPGCANSTSTATSDPGGGRDRGGGGGGGGNTG